MVTVDGKSIPGQMTRLSLLAKETPPPDQQVSREIHFILPEVKANAMVAR